MDARAARLHVESAGRGPPLVLLHGWALHGGLFATLVPALAQRHRVHAVDLPGHGHSDPVAGGSVGAVVMSLEHAFAGERAPLAVLGWSFGGMIALHWAAEHPARIDRLALVSTTPKFVAAADWPHAMAPATLDRFADELAAAYRLTLQRFLTLQVQGGDAARATLAALRRELFTRGAPDPAALAAALSAMREVDLRARLAFVATPTLVIRGDRDTLVPPEASAWLAQALPAAKLATVPGAAHVPFLSHRAAFLDALLPFLSP